MTDNDNRLSITSVLSYMVMIVFGILIVLVYRTGPYENCEAQKFLKAHFNENIWAAYFNHSIDKGRIT